MNDKTLVVEDLKTHFFTRAGVVRALDGVSFAVKPGEVLGLVGESGCGKTVCGFSILGLVDPPGRVVGGRVLLEGVDLLKLREPELRKVRGRQVAMVFQDPMMTLNPVLRIDTQILYEAQKLCRESGTALIWITHDLSVVAGLADRICVMYAGRIVEAGAVDDVLDAPLHPYTHGLIGSVPSRNRRGAPLAQIPGMMPALTELPPGCAFRARCARAAPACSEVPRLEEVGNRLVRCFFPL